MLNKRLINFRPIFFLFIVLITTIFTFVYTNLSLYYLILLIIPILFLFLLIYKKKFIFLAVSVVLIIASSLISFFGVKNYSNLQYNNVYAVVNADIQQINGVSNNFYYLILSNCNISTEKELNVNLDGNISLELSIYDDSINFEEGDKIVFASNLVALSFFDEYNQINSFYINKNVKYFSKINYSQDVSFFKQDINIIEKLKNYNHQLLVENFGQKQGELAYALMYGAKQNADEQIMQVFKYSGVMHIFSVSGLHVSLIVALLYFVISKLPINKYFKFLITALFLFVYCLLCSFSASVFRASVMCLVVLFAKLFYKKPDVVNSFSIAGLILLTINPFNLFNGGFQMSFVAVFGIIFFSNLFNKIKIKNKFIKNIISFVGVSISTTLAMIPILAKFYGYVATWSLLSNLITLPLFSIFYPILFITNLIVLVFPFLAFLYVIPQSFLNVLIYINQLIVFLPCGFIKIKRMGIVSTVFYFLTIFSVSKYLMIKPISKIILCLSLFVVSLTSWYVFLLPKINNQNAIVTCSSNLSSATIIATKNNKYYLVNPQLNKLSNLRKWLDYQKIDNFEAVILTTNEPNYEAKDLFLFLKDYNNPTVYMSGDNKCYTNLIQLGLNCIRVEDRVVIKDLIVDYIYYQDMLVASLIKQSNFTYATLDCNNLTQSEINYVVLNNLALDIDVAKIYNNDSSYKIEMQNANNIVYDLENNLNFVF